MQGLTKLLGSQKQGINSQNNCHLYKKLLGVMAYLVKWKENINQQLLPLISHVIGAKAMDPVLWGSQMEVIS